MNESDYALVPAKCGGCGLLAPSPEEQRTRGWALAFRTDVPPESLADGDVFLVCPACIDTSPVPDEDE